MRSALTAISFDYYHEKANRKKLALMAGPGVGMKPMIASSAVLIDQLGCHDSGW